MRLPLVSTPLFLLLALGSAVLAANPVSRVAPGEVNHVEGTAYLNGRPLPDAPAPSLFLANGNRLATADGRVEVLLNPGSFLRLGNHTEVEFTSLDPTQVELRLVKGRLLLEIVESDGHSPSMRMGRSVATAFQPGIYEGDADRCRMEVYEGTAQMGLAGERMAVLRRGDATSCKDDQLQVQRFDPNKGDALYAWSARASEYEAAASYGAASVLKRNSRESAWYWDPGMGCWAFVPAAGIISGPFGWSFAAAAQISRASILTGPVFHYPAAVNPYNHPRRLSLPSTGGWVDIAHAPRISRPNITAPIDMGRPPSIPIPVPH